MKEKPQVAAFINFYLTRVNEEILTSVTSPPLPRPSMPPGSAWTSALSK